MEVLASKGIATRALVRDTAKATGSAAIAGLGSTTEVRPALRVPATPPGHLCKTCAHIVHSRCEALALSRLAAHRRSSYRCCASWASCATQVVRGDVTHFGSLPPAMEDVSAVICCTGARDVSNPLSPFLVDFEVRLAPSASSGPWA